MRITPALAATDRLFSILRLSVFDEIARTLIAQELAASLAPPAHHAACPIWSLGPSASRPSDTF